METGCWKVLQQGVYRGPQAASVSSKRLWRADNRRHTDAKPGELSSSCPAPSRSIDGNPALDRRRGGRCYRCGRGERDRVTEDEIMGHQYHSDRGHSASFKRRETEDNCSGGARDHRMPEYGGANETFLPRAIPMFQVPSVGASVLVAKPGGASSAKNRFCGTKGTPW